MMCFTQYAVRMKRSLNNTGTPVWEESMHNGHHTVCGMGGTYIA